MRNKKYFVINANSPENFYEKLREKCSENEHINTGIIFINGDLDADKLKNLVSKEIKYFIGASSAREIHNGKVEEKHCVGVFFHIPIESFNLISNKGKLNYNSGRDFGISVKNFSKNSGVYILVAGIDNEVDQFVSGVQESTNQNIPMYGGVAMDNMKMERFIVFTNDGLIEKGYAAMVLDCDLVKLVGDSFSGWNSIGMTHVVTKSNKNEILEVDNQPALELFSFYFDYIDFEDSYKMDLPCHPIQVIENDGVVHTKSTMDINTQNKSLLFNCVINEGTKFKFCGFPDIGVKKRYLEHIRNQELGKEDFDFMIISSCVRRLVTLGPISKLEVSEIYETCATPMVGFLASGEIGNIRKNNKSYFHNLTNILTGFKLLY